MAKIAIASLVLVLVLLVGAYSSSTTVLVLADPLGPGAHPWVVATPESKGLSAEALEAAASAVNGKVRGRNCFLVVKEGDIVFEKYYGRADQTTVNTGFSTTKSMCSSIFGIARQQGWGDINAKVADSVGNPLKCNRNATMKNVLTMTGDSPDIDTPRFNYDAVGTNCYETLSSYISENNPEGLSASQWQQKYFWSQLGMEHSSWGGWLPELQCATSGSFSCRDLARPAQLWLNEGQWPGFGQLMSKEHANDGTQWVFGPDNGDPYGFGVRLRPDDPVDPDVAFFGGIFVQCAYFSRKHQAIVISMGLDPLGDCKSSVWDEARDAVVSRAAPGNASTHK